MSSDEELIRGVLSRDAGAFDSLFARHSQAVRGRLRRILRNDAAAEDLFQEVFLRLWTRADQWTGEGSVRAWVLAIATNLALNYLRSARRRKDRPLDIRGAAADQEDRDSLPGWMIDASALGPEAAAELSERAELSRRFVDELPEDKRDVIRMVYEEQMGVLEVAERLGIPPGTVKSRLFHGRSMLRRSWHDIEPEWEDA